MKTKGNMFCLIRSHLNCQSSDCLRVYHHRRRRLRQSDS